MEVGVLALQGDVAEHGAALELTSGWRRAGAPSRRPRRARRHRHPRGRVDHDVDAARLLGPGRPARQGARRRAARLRHLRRDDPAGDGCVDGRPDQRCFGAIDIAVRRNGFGRQLESFESDLERCAVLGAARCTPCSSGRRWSRPTGPEVEVLAALEPDRAGGGDVSAGWRTRRAVAVLCRQGPVAGRGVPSGAHRRPQADACRSTSWSASSSAASSEQSERSRARTVGHVRPLQVGDHQAPQGGGRQGSGKLFAKLIRQVEVAAREGGGDLNANATLRTMFEKARDASVPLDTIERAIKRGTGELEGVRYEEVVLRGLRAGRRGDHRRVPHRQPQPHRRRDPQRLHQQRRLHGRARRGGVAVRAQGRDRAAPGSRRGRSWRWPSRPAPRTSPTRATSGW